MKVLLPLILFITFFDSIYSQESDDILVQFGDKSITVEEFKYRYEFTPQINRKMYDKDKAREEFLYTLIAENLFAAEAEKMGLDTSLSFKVNYEPLKKMHFRDALYKELIKDKVKLDEVKFNEGLKLANNKLFVEFIYADEKKDIDKAYEIISRGPNFDSLVTFIENSEYVSEPYEVNYGKMYYKAERAIYNLEMNEFTKPIESPEGWYIFKLVGKVPVAFQSNEQRNSLVGKVVEGRVEDSIFSDFWMNFFSDQKIVTDGSLFWYFAEKVHELILEEKKTGNIKDGGRIALSNDNFAELKRNMHPDSLKKVFIRFEVNPVTLEMFINDFVFEGFYTFKTDLNKIASQLNSRVKRQIELELLTREADSRGMENLPEVKNSTEIWKENYLATLYMKNIVKNMDLSDNDLTEYFKDMGDTSITEIKVNIIELLTDSLKVIKEALSLSSNEAQFREFAGKHTKREWTKEKGGEFGLFPISEHGEIGKIASSMEIGDVYGPLKIDNSYSIFKLIDKQTDSLNINELNISENIQTRLRFEKVIDYLENTAANLADKYNVKINNSILKSLDLLNSQMVVFRYMGFGGRIMAYPYASPFYKWKEKWEQKKRDLL